MKEYELSASYPKFSRLKPNSYYQGLLQNLYSGVDGEICAVLQYAYFSFNLSTFGNEHAKLFSELVEDELLHAKKLAELIIMLGGDPIFASTQGKWLSGRSVDYIKSVKQMFMLAIELKEKLIIDYKSAIIKIDEMTIKRALEGILHEEESHLIMLKNVYRSFGA